MADKYDKNGFNSSDFKRNATQDQGNAQEQDGEDNSKVNAKADEYMRELLSEKIKLNNSKFPYVSKLIDQEISKVQATGRLPAKDTKYVDVFRDKPTKVVVKVLVPIKEHPKFNFVGKLLGPKGNTMKQLQEETMCKMAVLGRGSMRDRQKEEELRNSLDPKYAHLSDELHVEVTALAPPAEAHARIAYALAEVKKYLIPDNNEPQHWQPQMREMDRGAGHGHQHPGPGGPPRGAPGPGGPQRGAPGPGGPPRGVPRAPPPPRMPPASMQRPMPAKSKVMSILDRARTAMEGSYPYEDPYGAAPEPPSYQQAPQIRGGGRGGGDQEFFYERSHDRFYEDEGSYYKEEPREFKSARAVGTRRAAPHGPAQHGRPYAHAHARHEPYARPPK